MKTAVAIRHVHFEDLGTFEQVLLDRGYRASYYDVGGTNPGTTQVDCADLLVVLGAPIGACDESIHPFLMQELKWIEQRLSAKAPLLGICLGAQLMARALGAEVKPMVRKEIGFSTLEITAAGRASALGVLPEGTAVLHWHSDQFALPSGTESLARTTICPNQAFAIKNQALGLQFHLEADTDRIEHWLLGHASELSQAGINPCSLRAQAELHGMRLKEAAHAVFHKWLDSFE